MQLRPLSITLVVALALACLLACAYAAPKDLSGYTFAHYTAEFQKFYASAEETSMRRSIFEKNLASIIAHNARGDAVSYTRGVNHLTDRTPDELKALRGYRKEMIYERHEARQMKASHEFDNVRLVDLPSHIDWSEMGMVSDVKDQGNCGSCWTFATAESIESRYAILTGQLNQLSEQQILDCTPNPNECGGTGGCQGGTTELAFERMISTTGGLSSEWTYPYMSYQNKNFKTCSFNASLTPVVVKVTDYTVLPSNQYEPVLNALQYGPLAVALDASAWSDYSSGVFTGCNNANPDIDHGVLLVGYGTDPKYGDYYKIKNSWGPAWGEDGYIRIARTGNVCGVDLNPSDGTACKNGPPNVTVCGDCAILYDVTFPVVAPPSA